MKKIILIVLGLVMMFNISSKKVSASTSKEEVSEPIVVKVGSNLNNYIKYDNYVVVSNSVNINEAGIYTITYKNIDTLEEVKKEVHVIEDDTYAFEVNYSTLYAENNAVTILGMSFSGTSDKFRKQTYRQSLPTSAMVALSLSFHLL